MWNIIIISTANNHIIWSGFCCRSRCHRRLTYPWSLSTYHWRSISHWRSTSLLDRLPNELYPWLSGYCLDIYDHRRFGWGGRPPVRYYIIPLRPLLIWCHLLWTQPFCMSEQNILITLWELLFDEHTISIMAVPYPWQMVDVRTCLWCTLVYVNLVFWEGSVAPAGSSAPSKLERPRPNSDTRPLNIVYFASKLAAFLIDISALVSYLYYLEALTRLA